MPPLSVCARGDDFLVLSAVTGLLDTNTYMLLSSGSAAVFDPAGSATLFARAAADRNSSIDYVILTHTHADHMAAAAELLSLAPNAVFAVPALESDWLRRTSHNLSYAVGGIDSPPDPSLLLHDGDMLPVGSIRLCCLSLPGHTPGSTAYLVSGRNVLFSGDILFRGSVGRVDLPGGDEPSLVLSLRRIVSLPHDTVVLPGHGPATTLSAEIASNPFITSLPQTH
ncbi:MAG: MBL fold metallo-hydrolase [Planctomycetes bacterium]|nr:MBL fold metallo-hydrolase [Planctomycetota bacterium]